MACSSHVTLLLLDRINVSIADALNCALEAHNARQSYPPLAAMARWPATYLQQRSLEGFIAQVARLHASVAPDPKQHAGAGKVAAFQRQVHSRVALLACRRVARHLAVPWRVLSLQRQSTTVVSRGSIRATTSAWDLRSGSCHVLGSLSCAQARCAGRPPVRSTQPDVALTSRTGSSRTPALCGSTRPPAASAKE